jgi:hypothetical protein
MIGFVVFTRNSVGQLDTSSSSNFDTIRVSTMRKLLHVVDFVIPLARCHPGRMGGNLNLELSKRSLFSLPGFVTRPQYVVALFTSTKVTRFTHLSIDSSAHRFSYSVSVGFSQSVLLIARMFRSS